MTHDEHKERLRENLRALVLYAQGTVLKPEDETVEAYDFMEAQFEMVMELAEFWATKRRVRHVRRKDSPEQG